MKKIMVALVFLLFSTAVFAQDGVDSELLEDEGKAEKAGSHVIKLTGEIKTGIVWTKNEDSLLGVTNNNPNGDVDLGSKDDAGGAQGRFRLDLDYFNTNINIGFKLRMNWENWVNGTADSASIPRFPIALGYGNFFKDQLTLSIGVLGNGGSPWGTGGPEMWTQLEEAAAGGMRLEYKPTFYPEKYGRLNIGFVINNFNSPKEAGNEIMLSLLEILKESVLGFEYKHQYFLVRFAYRFDSNYDQRVRNVTDEGGDIIYRAEEKYLEKFDLKIHAIGRYRGVGSPHDHCKSYENWLFAEYNPKFLTAQLRLGLDVVADRMIFHFRPSFYYHFFKDRLLTVGVQFLYGQDFGEGKVQPGAPFNYIQVEPKIQVNFSQNAYVAFAYNFRREVQRVTQTHTDRGVTAPYKQDQWMNLRFGLSF